MGIAGLKRVRMNQAFTESSKTTQAIQEYEEENNPIVGFIRSTGKDMIINQPTNEVYKRYQVFMADNGFAMPVSNIVFSKYINKALGTEVKQKKINGVKFNLFMEVQD